MECQLCGEDVEELQSVKADGKRVRACEDCAERANEAAEIASDATSAMQTMMEYKGGKR